jgi:uracil-DNA glycosylase family 4
MEKKFQELSKKIKALNSHQTDVSKTFESELFKKTNWFFGLSSINENLQLANKNVEVQTPPHKEIEKKVVLLNSDSKMRVLFVGDSYKGEGEDLLAKMITAMKLEPHEFSRLTLDPLLEEIEYLEDNRENPNDAFKILLNEIEICKPDYVVSLGAIVTNLLLGRREKMSAIHGRFFNIKALEWNVQLMPLFHPDFLIINPNMKRTAWIDLQKLMELIGKN